MKFQTLSKCAAAAVVLTLSVAVTPARAQSGDCPSVVKTLKEYGDNLMKKDLKTPAAICSGMGSVVALAASIREIANQCYEDGKERTDLMKEMDDTLKAMQREIDKDCK